MNVNEAFAMLLTQEAQIEQHAHILYSMDVKHNFETNFAQNRGPKIGNVSGGKRFRGFNYNFDYNTTGNFGNGYKGG